MDNCKECGREQCDCIMSCSLNLFNRKLKEDFYVTLKEAKKHRVFNDDITRFIKESSIMEFYEDLQILYEKGNVTFSAIYLEVPQCRMFEDSYFFEIQQNGTPKYWIEFVKD